MKRNELYNQLVTQLGHAEGRIRATESKLRIAEGAIRGLEQDTRKLQDRLQLVENLGDALAEHYLRERLRMES